jgi:transposase-like protein
LTTTLQGVGSSMHADRMAEVPDPEVPERAKRRRFTAGYKLAILDELDRAVEPGAKGAILRREGLYTSHIVEWRRARDTGALAALGQPRGRKPANPLAGEVERLRRRAERLEAELDRARLVIAAQGNLSALLEGLLAESAQDRPKQ